MTQYIDKSIIETQGEDPGKEEQNEFAKGVLSNCAMSFIDYLDTHKYEGKMCVSNIECEDIENAFHNTMWDRLHRYYCKYINKSDFSIKWEKNIANNKPALNHSVLIKSIHGIAEGEWNGKEWIQYRWSSKIKDNDVLYWMNLYEPERHCKYIEKQETSRNGAEAARQAHNLEVGGSNPPSATIIN